MWKNDENVHPVYFKKFWGLGFLGRAYRYYIMVDAEGFVIRPFSVLEWCRDYFAAKVVYGNPVASSLVRRIIQKSSWRFDADERKRLKAATGDWRLYAWFNEVPLLETESALDFINRKIYGQGSSTNETSKDKTLTLEFDWLAYAYFMMLEYGFKLVDVNAAMKAQNSSEYHGPQSFGEGDGGSASMVEFTQPHWATLNGWLQERQKFNCSPVFLLFHLDRVDRGRWPQGAHAPRLSL
jgi:hypothetical protein